MKTITLNNQIPEQLAGKRLDTVLAQLFSDYSRSQIQAWIRQGFVEIDGKVIQKTRYPVKPDQKVAIHAELEENPRWEAQPIPISVIYEDDALLIVNKPVGLVVHPGAGNPDNTLVNALLNYAPELASLPRAGIIHRIDKDTSGLLVVARTLDVHNALAQQMQNHEISREYYALVYGNIISGGTVDAPIGRHPTHRTKMAVIETGKEAVTHYRVSERFQSHTLLSVRLKTGRTHQIRVHLAHINHPIVGDNTYGTRRHRHYPHLTKAAQKALMQFNHQALHAYQIRLVHPATHAEMVWTAPLPQDMENLIQLLKADAKLAKGKNSKN